MPKSAGITPLSPKFTDFELYKLYYASHLCRGIGQTSCSFEHVSCVKHKSLKFVYTGL